MLISRNGVKSRKIAILQKTIDDFFEKKIAKMDEICHNET